MITLSVEKGLTAIERSQLERKELARGAWAEGRPEDGLLILESVTSEEMTPRVAAECLVTEAAFFAEQREWERSLESLRKASEFIDAANPRVQGSFYHQRARIHKELGNMDAALTDYGGATANWEQANAGDLVGKPALNVAGIYLAVGDLTLAHEHTNRAITIFTETNSPDLSQAYDTQANIYYAEGQLRLACQSINKALELVGDNELWQQEFLLTQRKIKTKLLELLDIKSVKELDQIQVNMVRSALIEKGGAYEAAGTIIGMSRKGIEYMVDSKDELKEFRKTKRVRRKSIIKRSA